MQITVVLLDHLKDIFISSFIFSPFSPPKKTGLHHSRNLLRVKLYVLDDFLQKIIINYQWFVMSDEFGHGRARVL